MVEHNDTNKTTIAISVETKEKLIKKKLVAMETYDSVINRLLA